MNTDTDKAGREEILSQEETDALLQGIEDGSIVTGAGKTSSGEVIPYDFAECERLSRGAMPTLQIINTRIARSLRDSLSDLLRRPVHVETASSVAMRYSDHIPTLPLPASLNLVRLPPLPGAMLIVPESRLIYMTVDCFFGGKGKIAEETSPREFTQVEQRMVSLLLERVFAAMSDGWEPVMDIEPELIGQEQNPQLAAIASGNEPVIVTCFGISIGEDSFRLELITPRTLLEPVEEMLDSAPRGDNDEAEGHWRAAVRDRLEETRIGLRTSLTHTTLRLGDILSLQPGDVIAVDLPEQVTVEAAGTPVFSARIGVSRNHNAVEIVAPAHSGVSSTQNTESHS